jgi:GPH family glycoside/pentoside/hexuronide:cation symporter
MPVQSVPSSSASPGRVPRWMKIVYGSGDWGMATFGTVRQVFYAIFLTDVVGLEPRLASLAALVGIVWDAINDPLVGTLSDKVNTRWGRRRPFLLLFSVPFGLAFLLLWWAPPWGSQFLLMVHVTLAYMISDTLQTLVTVPFFALTPEMTEDYDERTSLTGYRMFFNLLASMAAAVGAPMIVDSAAAAGLSTQQGYLIMGAIFGGLAAIPFLIIALVVRERARPTVTVDYTLRQAIQTTWANVPFRYATGLYMLNWITFDLVGLMLPYFLIYWVARGDLIAMMDLFGARISLESVVFAFMLLTAVISLPLWTFLARRLGKHVAYVIGMAFWALVQCVVITIQPGQYVFIVTLAVFTGLSVSTAHVLPDAIFPDVIEWDELKTGVRHEGLYYGAKNLIRKLTGAVAIFMALQVLGWLGYQAPPEGATTFAQSPRVIAAIRFLTGPMGALFLVGAIAVAWFYPLTRERHQRVQRLLALRRQKRARLSQPAKGINTSPGPSSPGHQ